MWTDELVEIILSGRYMTLATASRDGIPWVSPVVYGCDADLAFYWVSAKDARHSVNVATNPRGALTIFDSDQTSGDVQGVYSEGPVEILGDQALSAATRVFYGWRYPDPATMEQKLRGPEEFEGDSPRRMYRLVPAEVYGLDPAGDPVHGSLLDSRVAVDIGPAFRAAFAQRSG
jgi:nitroimidazol reductase NimA-like FMN-containing flavoprotein (pyridoxamine 5'-phosphate oxidase superfamily)